MTIIALLFLGMCAISTIPLGAMAGIDHDAGNENSTIAVVVHPQKQIADAAIRNVALKNFLLGAVKYVLPLGVGYDFDFFQITGWNETNGGIW